MQRNQPTSCCVSSQRVSRIYQSNIWHEQLLRSKLWALNDQYPLQKTRETGKVEGLFVIYETEKKQIISNHHYIFQFLSYVAYMFHIIYCLYRPQLNPIVNYLLSVALFHKLMWMFKWMTICGSKPGLTCTHTRQIVGSGSPSENKLSGSVIILAARSLHTHTATNRAMYRFGNFWGNVSQLLLTGLELPPFPLKIFNSPWEAKVTCDVRCQPSCLVLLFFQKQRHSAHKSIYHLQTILLLQNLSLEAFIFFFF